jgi:hypothetical protein
VYSPAPADLNLDGAGKPLSFFSAIRGPHGKEWTLADEQQLIKLLVTLKCLLPVMRPAKNPAHLKRVVKEKWDKVHRLRKRRVRWTIGGDKINVDYEVGTNTAALPTVNALFHSIVSTHSFMATIDIVDYYLGAILPSPESVRIMRLDWLKERASWQFFRLVFLPGLINPADFFTKILPTYRHLAALPFLYGTPYPISFPPNPLAITPHPHARSSRHDAVHDRDPPALATP